MSDSSAWYGVRVRSRCEQIASASLRSKGYEEFLPLARARRQWSDRVRYLDQPLFPGYVFCRFDARSRIPVLQSPGVVSLLSFGSQVIPIPDEEIQAIRRMLESSIPLQAYPYLASGQKIRIDRGPLQGAEGIVVEIRKQFRLVASITLLQRSVSVEIERDWVTPIS